MSDTTMYLSAAVSAVRATINQPDLTEAERDELVLIHDQLSALLEGRQERVAPRYR